MNIISKPMREELFEVYTTMVNEYTKLRRLMREVGGFELDQAKAYWLGFIESGLRCEEHVGNNPTFRSFLESAGIIDEDGEYLEEEEEEEDA